MRPTGPVRLLATLLATGALIVGAGGSPQIAGASTAPVVVAPDPGVESAEEPVVESIPEEDRTSEIGPDWKQSDDVAWAVTGDSTALHVMVGLASSGYAWKEVAALSVDGLETDRWVGNACLSSDSQTIAVVYGPRAFTNDQGAMSRGGFAAVVEIATGMVHHLEGGYSLAYFNPTCGMDAWSSFTQFSDTGVTRVVSVNGTNTAESSAVESDSFVTSAVRTETTLVGAVAGGVVEVAGDGQVTVLQAAEGSPYNLAPTLDGLAYMETDGEKADAMLLTDDDAASVLATGPLTEMDLAADASGDLYILGKPSDLPDTAAKVEVIEDAPVGSQVSSDGALVVASALAAESTAQSGAATVLVDTRSVRSGNEFRFGVDVESGSAPVSPDAEEIQGDTSSFSTLPHSVAVPANSTSPSYSESPCAVPRNDPANQALQPRPAQVEWAVDQAVRGALLASRPAWQANLGLGEYKPQELFPRPALAGFPTGRVPASILLGVLAQESNLSQASIYTVPGVTGNPLMGNYYGVNKNSGDFDAWWDFNYEDVDCGYGIGQVTDLMRAGQMPYIDQRRIALDYEANIARSLQILVEKWNQTRSGGLVVNDGNPAYLENWFFALWAYNSGFHPQSEAGPGGAWGVGWFNNPANPIYPANRHPFLDGSPQDGAKPQEWPYPEKVLGFAAHSVQLLDHVTQGSLGDDFSYGPAYAPGWWRATDGADGESNRWNVKPPIYTFCNTTNDCNPAQSVANDVPGQPNGPCYHVDPVEGRNLECWFHATASWKTSCADYCGYDSLTFAQDTTGATRPANATSYAPCNATGLPAGALVIDNLPNSTPIIRPGCQNVTTSAGTFQFDFADDGTGRYPSRVDLQQLGSGVNAHFNFAHTRVPNTANSYDGVLDINGTWTLNQSLNGWARVYVHMPNHGAWAQQARYKVNTGLAVTERSVNQRHYANKWVPLGAMQFSGVPSVSLSNASGRYAAGSGKEDIAWDAVAFVPLSQKPTEFVVALGDSYSSGEGTSSPDGAGFFRSTDNNGSGGVFRNACHRSFDAWPYKIKLPSLGGGQTIRQLADANDPRLDFHLLACSGATSTHIRSSTYMSSHSNPRYGEENQLDSGFVDQNTTLVTMTVGGNDVGFSPILTACKFALICSTETAPDDPELVPPGLEGESMRAVVDARIDQTRANVLETLQQIHAKAPTAKILLLGYPSLFESYSGRGINCVMIPATAQNGEWLNGITADLNRVLTDAAIAAGPHVTYETPQYRFSGRNLCTADAAINPLVWSLTPGDDPLADLPLPGPNGELGPSSQSVHPNTAGTTLYADVANNALRSVKLPLSGTLTAGAPTYYYSTFRYHDGGPIAFNITSFSSCGEEMRLGLRRSTNSGADQVVGQQHTTSLAWREPNEMQNFLQTTSTPNTPDIASGYYAMNARMTATCSGSTVQSWAGTMHW